MKEGREGKGEKYRRGKERRENILSAPPLLKGRTGQEPGLDKADVRSLT